jgi:hypothetical protein
VWVANVEGTLSERAVSLSDPSTGDTVDSTRVSLGPLAWQSVVLGGGELDELRLQVGVTDVESAIIAVARRKSTNFSRGMKPTTENQPTTRKQPGVLFSSET